MSLNVSKSLVTPKDKVCLSSLSYIEGSGPHRSLLALYYTKTGKSLFSQVERGASKALDSCPFAFAHLVGNLYDLDMLFPDDLVVLRGGGDLATGVAYRLHKAGFPLVVLELARPLVVRRRVALATAVLEDIVGIEGLVGRRVATWSEARALAVTGQIPVLVQPDWPPGGSTSALPATPKAIKVLVDARLAKRNIDTDIEQAPLVIALGPGFNAGDDCHAVVETKRGHSLGRVIWWGPAQPNTGRPGTIAGKEMERVLRSPVAGPVTWQVDIGDIVVAGQPIGRVGNQSLSAPFAGVIRGLIAPGHEVPAGYKIGDLDARADRQACFTISDKSLAVGGGVLEAILDAKNAGRL